VTAAILYTVVALALLVALVWLLRRPASWMGAEESERSLELENLFPLHCRHFPQIRQALSEADAGFLRGRASRRALKEWRAERRHVLRQFLAGLGQDFARLDRLARTVAALSPEVSREREVEQLWLRMQFLLLHRLVSLRLAAGLSPLPQVARLTELVGSFAAQIDMRMAALGQKGLLARQ
jgi:hypothetical protein